MRTTDHRPHPKPGARTASWASPARPLLLLLAAFLACAVALLIVSPALAQSASDDGREARDGGRSGDKGSGNALGVIVDIPDGWPLEGGDHDIVRFEKCFPFCNVDRPSGESTGGGGGSEEQTSIIEQTQIQEETQTDEGTTEDDGTEDGGSDQYETDEGNGGSDDGDTGSGEDDNGGGNGEDEPEEPEEPTVSEETTVLEETTTFEGTTAPPGETAKCPTGPSGPISEVTLTQVLDADTLQVEGSDGNAYTIRLIGAEAPDLAGGGAEGGEDEPSAEDAAAFAKEVLGGSGQKLQLEYDAQKTDENGQTFAYVWIEGAGARPGPATSQLLDNPETAGPVLYNRMLVEEGYARAATAEPNTDYAECLEGAEEAARQDAAGLWAEQGSLPGPGSPSGSAETAAGISVDLLSSKTPLKNARAEGGAGAGAEDKVSGTPPITGHATPPEPTTAREPHPGLTVVLALGLVAASLVTTTIVLRRGTVGPAVPAGANPSENGN